MKRSLHVVSEGDVSAALTPSMVIVGNRIVSVTDTGSGADTARFVDALLDAGARRWDAGGDPQPSLRIVIRTAHRSTEARVRAEALEATADLVLGSVRAAFARRFVSACASWANS